MFYIYGFHIAKTEDKNYGKSESALTLKKHCLEVFTPQINMRKHCFSSQAIFCLNNILNVYGFFLTFFDAFNFTVSIKTFTRAKQ